MLVQYLSRPTFHPNTSMGRCAPPHEFAHTRYHGVFNERNAFMLIATAIPQLNPACMIVISVLFIHKHHMKCYYEKTGQQ